MYKTIPLTLLISLITLTLVSQSFRYGHNDSIGQYADVNGIKMYYEEYGSGEPLFLIHGNGGDIKSMEHQIDHFKNNYRVIIADNRGHGQSELNTDSLTYVNIAKDWAALADHLEIDSVNVIGWSDGGILGILLGINHPSKVNKIIAMGANMRPDTTAVYPWAVNWVADTKKYVESQLQWDAKNEKLKIQLQHLNLLGQQPTITKSDLAKIKSPCLIVAGDKDIIREEHTVELYQGIPKAQLCILPGQTHFIPSQDPILFNSVAEKFLKEEFKRPDSNWTK